MSFAQLYSEPHYKTARPFDRLDQTERERLSSHAIRAFQNIMERWKIRDGDAQRLLGKGNSNGAYYALRKENDCVLDEDKILRISCLVGIFKALNLLYSEELADRWIQMPNKNRMFDGITPHEYLVQGGLPAFMRVRKLLDARRVGH